jgi:hypothetical protein
MPNCKQCGTKYSSWSARADSLCKDCGTKADEIARQEAERKEAERKQQVLEDSIVNIGLIVKAMTAEPPLSYTFVNWGIKEEKSGGWTGVLVGGALFGIAGAMVGNCLAPGSCTYSGEIGILVITQSQILIGHFTAPLPSGDGRIVPDHLELFRSQLDSDTIVRKEFNICQTQVSRPPQSDTVVNLVCGSEGISFGKSDLYINDAIYELPGAVDIQNRIAQLGTLVTPAEFVANLYRGEDPVSENQVSEIVKDDNYVAAVFSAIIRHKDRDIMVQNLPCLAPSVRDVLESRIRNKGASYGSVRMKFIVWTVLAIAGVIAIAVTEDFLCFLFVVGTVIATIVSITSAVDLRRSMWCRDIFRSESLSLQ